MINITKTRDNFAFFALLGLFWFYPAYSILRSLGYPSIALPVFLYLLTIIIILLSVSLTFKSGVLKFNIYTVAVISLFIYVLGVQFTAYWNLSNEFHDYYFQRSQMSFAYSTLCLVIGLNINNIIAAYKSSENLKAFIKMAYIFLLGTVSYSIFSNLQSTGQFQIVYTIDYLMIADGLAIVLLILFIMKRNLLFMILGAVLISATISRGVMFSWVVSIILYYILREKINFKKISVIILAGVIGFSFYAYIKNSPQSFMNTFGENRSAEILVNVISDGLDFEDPSRDGREMMQEQGIEDLKNVWFFGQYMRELDTGLGYIHNWLSFWVAYGILPFLFFCSLYLLLLVRVFLYSRKSNDIQYKLIFIISVYILIQILLFRSYFYPLVWLALAGLSKVLEKTKNTNRDN